MITDLFGTGCLCEVLISFLDVLDSLESGLIGMWHGLLVEESHPWYLQIFPSSIENPSCDVGFAFAFEWGCKPRSRGYGDVTVIYMRRREYPHVYSKYQ